LKAHPTGEKGEKNPSSWGTKKARGTEKAPMARGWEKRSKREKQRRRKEKRGTWGRRSPRERGHPHEIHFICVRGAHIWRDQKKIWGGAENTSQGTERKMKHETIYFLTTKTKKKGEFSSSKGRSASVKGRDWWSTEREKGYMPKPRKKETLELKGFWPRQRAGNSGETR